MEKFRKWGSQLVPKDVVIVELIWTNRYSVKITRKRGEAVARRSSKSRLVSSGSSATGRSWRLSAWMDEEREHEGSPHHSPPAILS